MDASAEVSNLKHSQSHLLLMERGGSSKIQELAGHEPYSPIQAGNLQL